MSILGNNLRKCRKDMNLTQEQVSAATKIPRGTYAQYELGRREPDNETLIILAAYYKTTPSKLLGFNLKDEENSIRDLNDFLSNDDVDITLNGRIIKPEDKKVMLDILKVYHSAKEK